MMYAKLLHSEKALLLYPSFTNRRTEILSLNSEIFNPSLIYACFVNIGDESGDKFCNRFMSLQIMLYIQYRIYSICRKGAKLRHVH